LLNGHIRSVQCISRRRRAQERDKIRRTLDRLAHGDEDEGDRGPSLRHRNLQQRPDDPPRILTDISRVGDECKVVDVRLGDPRLEEYVDLARTRVGPSLDLTRTRVLNELLQLRHLILSNLDLVELDARGDESEDIRFAHAWSEHFVEDLDGRILDVIPRGDTSEVGRDEGTEVCVEDDHLRLYESFGGGGDESVSFAAEEGVVLDVRRDHTVDEGVLAHTNEEVRVAEPAYTLVHRRDGPETDFGVERIDESFDEPAGSIVSESTGESCSGRTWTRSDAAE
jgi:hypothetical protein